MLEQALLLVALLSLLFAVVVGFVPVTNPGVQSCGSPFVFSWHTSNDVVLPAPGSPSAPANDLQLLAQEPCHQRVDSRLLMSGLAVVVTVVAGLAGALVGLFDDRSRYRSSPRFEVYLRERPAEAPSDPWDQPVIPVHDLGERLPDIEWREVRVVVWVGIVAILALAWLGPWSDVRHAVEHLQVGWVLAAVVLVVVTYPLAAGGVIAATDGPDGSRRAFPPVLATAVAASFTGRLLPEYGPAGLAVHQLVRAGQDRRTALDCLTALDSVSPLVHTGVLVLVGVVAATASHGSGDALHWEWAVGLALLVGIVVGLIDAPRRYATLVVRPDRRSLAQLGRMTSDPVRLGGMVASALALALVNGLVVLVATRAFGASASAAAVLLVGLLLPVLVVVAPTPDGAGLVEAGLVLGLIWAGVDAGPAVAAMVLVRLVTFWIPMLPGWLALRRLEHSGEL
jgi:undecaprenyl-diphosphatase